MRDIGQTISTRILEWYDANARDLPWRVAPALSKAGLRPDPYRIWLSEVMLQQTTVAAVKEYFQDFCQRWPTVQDLAQAQDGNVMAAWAGLGYYARARNLLKCARVVTTQHDGCFPTEFANLLALPGIGPYTAAAIAAIAFNRPETVVDGNVERVMARLYGVEEPLPASKPTLAEFAAGLTPAQRAGDYAQGVMDLGATICTPRSPNCPLCPLIEICAAHATGRAGELPQRSPKPVKEIRRGIVYIAQTTDGAVLLERRPDKGLLGGMLGWPGGDWNDQPVGSPPIDANWRILGVEVRHTFTHFHLRLQVHVANDVDVSEPPTGFFVRKDEFRPADLPTVMRKAYDLASQPDLKV